MASDLLGVPILPSPTAFAQQPANHALLMRCSPVVGPRSRSARESKRWPGQGGNEAAMDARVSELGEGLDVGLAGKENKVDLTGSGWVAGEAGATDSKLWRAVDGAGEARSRTKEAALAGDPLTEIERPASCKLSSMSSESRSSWLIQIPRKPRGDSRCSWRGRRQRVAEPKQPKCKKSREDEASAKSK